MSSVLWSKEDKRVPFNTSRCLRWLSDFEALQGVSTSLNDLRLLVIYEVAVCLFGFLRTFLVSLFSLSRLIV